jgi:hypothetical protein
MINGCKVVNAGPNASSGQIEILLKAPGGKPFGEMWFVAAESAKKEILATALAAMTAEKTVNVEIEAACEMSTITKLLMTSWVAPTT